MLKFPEGYFAAETRDDFFISETMKRYWASCMEIVDRIDEICKRHNLTYYADFGTMLGAVRHKGFIPWDDDIDLCLFRPDYEKLLKYLKKELPANYCVSDPYDNPKHRQFFAGVSNGNVLDLSKDHMEQYFGCPFVATIDIFPLDYLPDNEEEANLIKDIFIIIWNVVDLMQKDAETEMIEKAICIVEQTLNVKIERNEYVRSQMWKLANQLVMSYGEADGSRVVEWCFYVNNPNRVYDKSLYETVEYVPFETINIPIPVGSKDILTTLYGDWNVHVKGSAGHDYPAFKEQLEKLREIVRVAKEQNGEISID